MLLEKIDQDLKNALKEKNENITSALRNLKAAIKNAEIDKKSALSDDEVAKVIAKKVKQHKDSIESFKSGGREDLVAIEQSQMSVLEAYLPKQMGESEVEEIVKTTIAKLNPTPSDFGKVMKEVMNQVAGRADGSIVSKLVKQHLNG